MSRGLLHVHPCGVEALGDELTHVVNGDDEEERAEHGHGSCSLQLPPFA